MKKEIIVCIIIVIAIIVGNIVTQNYTVKSIGILSEELEELKNTNGVVKPELVHNGEDGNKKALPLALESNGTMKMFHLFDFLMDTLRNGRVLFGSKFKFIYCYSFYH